MGTEYQLPPWADPESPPQEGTCRSCGAAIAWVIALVSRKRAPINPDGSSHFATCPEADRWRKS